MKRTFADLHLHINPLDQINTQNLLNKTAALGYKLVGIPFSPEAQADEISKVKNMCKIAD